MEKRRSTFSGELTAHYYNRIRNTPVLSCEDELALALRMKSGDVAARKKLVESNMRLVFKAACKFTMNDVPLMDIIQEGNIGLLKACDKFEPGHGARFSSYAWWWVCQHIMRFLEKNRRTIRLSFGGEKNLARLHGAYQELAQRLQREPTLAELAAETGVDVKEAQLLLNRGNTPASLDDPGTDGSRPVENLVADDSQGPDMEMLRRAESADMLEALKTLQAKERRVILWRYELVSGRPRTFKKIGESIGLSAESIRQIELKALKQLRQNETLRVEWLYA
jgi:RNA polymerase primary sigma factor